MATYIQNLLNNVLGDGARATKFEIDIIFSNPSLYEDASAVNTLCKSTTFPSKSHSKLDLKYKGRNIPLKGQTAYSQSIEMTFFLTEDHKLKHAFETWIEAMDQKHNYTNDLKRNPLLEETQSWHDEFEYTSSLRLYQKNFDGDRNLAEYTVYNVFPISVNALNYNSESVTQVQEFTVTFSYSHYDLSVLKGKDDNFIDEYVKKGKEAFGKMVDGAMEASRDKLNKLADDAVGAGKDAWNNLTSGGGKKTKSTTSNEAQKQAVKTPKDQKSTLQDVMGG